MSRLGWIGRLTLVPFLAGCSLISLADEHRGDEGFERQSNSKERRGIFAPTDSTYRNECGSCHMVYPAGLLPQRSWSKMMGGLKNHFGENASLDPATEALVRKFLISNAADQSNFRRSQKIAKAIPMDQTPLRFTETLYFKRQHHELSQKVWQRKAVGSPANCAACHSRAEAGIFSENEVKIPK